MKKMMNVEMVKLEGGGLIARLLIALAIEVIDNPDDFMRGFRNGYGS